MGVRKGMGVGLGAGGGGVGVATTGVGEGAAVPVSCSNCDLKDSFHPAIRRMTIRIYGSQLDMVPWCSWIAESQGEVIPATRIFRSASSARPKGTVDNVRMHA